MDGLRLLDSASPGRRLIGAQRRRFLALRILIVTIQVFLETAEGGAKVRSNPAQLACAENQQDHDRKDEEVPNAYGCS